jgi:hypothetical protein
MRTVLASKLNWKSLGTSWGKPKPPKPSCGRSWCVCLHLRQQDAFTRYRICAFIAHANAKSALLGSCSHAFHQLLISIVRKDALSRTFGAVQELLKERAINSLALLEEHAELKKAYSELEARLHGSNVLPGSPEQLQQQLQEAREARQLAERDYFESQKIVQNAQEELAAARQQQKQLCNERDTAVQVGCNLRDQ